VGPGFWERVEELPTVVEVHVEGDSVFPEVDRHTRSGVRRPPLTDGSLVGRAVPAAVAKGAALAVTPFVLGVIPAVGAWKERDLGTWTKREDLPPSNGQSESGVEGASVGLPWGRP
jgi:hypothetical protein